MTREGIADHLADGLPVHGAPADPDVEQEVALLRSVDAELRRLFVPPQPRDLTELLPRTRRVPKWAAVAAMLALALGSWLIVDSLASRARPDPYDPGPWQPLDRVFAEAEEHSFTPHWICADAEEFTRIFLDRHGAEVALDEGDGPALMLGLWYAHTLSTQTTCILGRKEEEPFMVFIDRADRAKPPVLDRHVAEARRWRLHQRMLGPLVLYELSASDDALLLDRFSIVKPVPGS